MDSSNPLSYGLQNEIALFYLDDPAFAAIKHQVIAKYPKQDFVLSGFLKSEDELAGRGALVQVGIGRGKILLFGFRPQHRAQSQGTYKFIFNALLNDVDDYIFISNSLPSEE